MPSVNPAQPVFEPITFVSRDIWSDMARILDLEYKTPAERNAAVYAKLSQFTRTPGRNPGRICMRFLNSNEYLNLEARAQRGEIIDPRVLHTAATVATCVSAHLLKISHSLIAESKRRERTEIAEPDMQFNHTVRTRKQRWKPQTQYKGMALTQALTYAKAAKAIYTKTAVVQNASEAVRGRMPEVDLLDTQIQRTNRMVQNKLSGMTRQFHIGDTLKRVIQWRPKRRVPLVRRAFGLKPGVSK